jgi:hypothetical protein
MCCLNAPDQALQEDAIRKELQNLYDRRSAVEMLIRSLEYYERFSAQGSCIGAKNA